MRSPFQSTRPLRGGTRLHDNIGHPQDISIHPPLAGRDPLVHVGIWTAADFNPPAPCGAGPPRSTTRTGCSNFNPPAPCGAGLCSASLTCGLERFQSARPLRGGTSAARITLSMILISIHPPLAGRDVYLIIIRVRLAISIHPPLAGRDASRPLCSHPASPFQSTRPLRGGTATR